MVVVGKTSGVALFYRAARKAAKSMMDAIDRKYRSIKSTLLSIIKKEELYGAYLCLEDTVMTSQVSERQRRSAISRKIRRVE